MTLLILPTSVTGSGVALPHIGLDTDASLDALQWVVHAYNLTFASFMLACGALADLLGRRRVFAVGAVLFTVASLVSAVVSDICVNSDDLAGPLEKLPEKVQPSFFDFVSEGFTGAWQVVLWASAVICALLSVAIYVMLSEKKKDVTVAKGGPAATPGRSEACRLPAAM
ncbi:MFS transporter [Streptomyces sp. NPDC021622]|uniref:MFS transporter n=1 Tax=Streptomyces sp. NPDC021622 TaxID=3155013 RepID=UPI0033CF8A15